MSVLSSSNAAAIMRRQQQPQMRQICASSSSSQSNVFAARSSRSSRRFFEVEVGGGDARVFFDRDRGVVERGGDGANDALLERRRQQKNRTPPGRNRRGRGFDDHGENGIDDFWPEDLKQLRTPIMAGNWKLQSADDGGSERHFARRGH